MAQASPNSGFYAGRFRNFLQLGLDNRPVFHLAGARRLMLIKSDFIASISTTGDTSFVEEITLRTGTKWNLFNELDNLSYSLTPEVTRNGTLYSLEVGFTASIQTRDKNSLFESLRNTDVTAVIQDRNNRWWLLGIEQPLQLTTQEQRIDNEVNQYSIKLTGRQRENVKEMSPVWVISLQADLFTDMLDSIDGTTLGIQVIAANNNGGIIPPAPTQLPNNFQNTITAPPSGYLIPDTMGVVFALPGTTIRLPANATNGEQHTVKDFTGNAAVSSIIISGNGRRIDGFPEARISSDYGALTFTYANLNWQTTAFVN